MTDPQFPSKILVIDGDRSVANSMVDLLKRYEINVLAAKDMESAFYLFNQNRIDVALIELDFSTLHGVAFVQKWRQHEVTEKRSTGFIMMIGQKVAATDEGLIKELGDIELISKPFTTIQLLPYLTRSFAAKKRALQYYELRSGVFEKYSKSGDFDSAAKEVHKNILKLGPRGLEMLYDLYEKGGKFDEALTIVTSLLDKNGNDISLINAKARILMRLGRHTEAQGYFERADSIAPQQIDRLNDMATMYLHLKKPDSAVAKFKAILKLNPENQDIKFEMFSKLYEFGYDEQAQALGKETTAPAEIVRHYNNKGVLLAKAGKGDDAATEYDRALKFYPKYKENYRILYNIALVHVNKKTAESYREAQKFLKRCLELAPDFEKAQKTLETINGILQKKA